MARRKASDKKDAVKKNRAASDEVTNVQADNYSIAFEELQIAGNVGGDIRIGHTIGYTAEQVSVLLKQITTTFQPKPFDGRCPYKGLEVFEEEDAELFFGRERLVNELVGRVNESRTVFITGPSGSGKSSLVRAGLIYALKQGKINALRSERWLYETMKPGREPVKDLALAFSRLKSPDLQDYFLAHAGETDILNKCAESVLSSRKDQRFVLFIDQFEEVFTQVNQEEERVAFINMLAHAGTVENGRVIVLFAMRSDFVSNCATYPMLNELLSQEFRQIGAMQPEELVSAIALPARQVGLPIEDELIARIINDMKGEPGALPLMQFALKDLFDSQQENGGVIALTLKDYLGHGGIHKSLERHADNTFSKLSESEQELTRSIFSGLIEIGRGTQDTKRTALFDELIPANAKAEDVNAVVQKLANARLVITDEQAGKDTVTISHEKLIDAWTWLKKLVNENRDVIALQNEIASDAKEWGDHHRDESYLYSGARLANAREQLETKKLVLSGLAQSFIEASVQAHTDELEAANQRAAQLRRQARNLTVALIAALIAVSAAVFFGFQARQQAKIAQSNAEEAQKQAAISRSQVLAMNSQFQRSKNQLSLLLALEAFKSVADLSHLERLPAEQAMRDSLSQVSGIGLSIHTGTIFTLAFSPNEHWLATGSDDAIVRLWNMNDPTAEPIVLRGHEDSIYTIAFTPDGRWLATGSWDNTARVWDMNDPTADPIVLRGHEDGITSLAFSPNGHWLATASWDNTARVWDMNDLTADPILLRGHENHINTLAFSPDGHWLATASDDATTRVWNMNEPTAEPIVLHGHNSYVSCLAFSPNGRWLASGSVDATARLWDMKNLSAEPIVLRGHEGSITSLAFSQDGGGLATGSLDTTIRVWSMNDLTAGSTVLFGHEGSITTLVFSPDGHWLATAGVDATIHMWNRNNLSSEPIVLRGHENSITTLAFSPDGRWLGSASSTMTARLWDMTRLSAEPNLLHGHEDEINALSFSPDGRWLATGSADTTVRVWDVNELASEPIVLRGYESGINTLAFSPDGHWLATGSTDLTGRVWDMQNLSAGPIVLRGHELSIRSLTFSSNGRWLATGSTDATVHVWDTQNQFADSNTLRGHEDEITTLAFSPDGYWLATGSSDDTARVWDMQNLSAGPIVLRGHTGRITGLAFSPNGHWLATSSTDMTVRVWDMTKLTAEPIILRGHEDEIDTLTFSPDGHWLATGSWDDTARLWDISPLRFAMTILPTSSIILRGHESGINSLSFSPDGRWLATGGADTTARLWDMHKPRAEPIVLHGQAINMLTFSPDGHWLATGSSDDTARVWNMNMDELAITACQFIGRNFTRAEWAQYFPSEEYRKTCEQWPLEPEITETPTTTA